MLSVNFWPIRFKNDYTQFSKEYGTKGIRETVDTTSRTRGLQIRFLALVLIQRQVNKVTRPCAPPPQISEICEIHERSLNTYLL